MFKSLSYGPNDLNNFLLILYRHYRPKTNYTVYK